MKGEFVKIKYAGIQWTVRKDCTAFLDVFSSPPKSLPRISGGRFPHAVFTVPETGEKLVIKQSRRGGILAKINKKCFLSPKRGLRELDITNYAMDKGVPTAPLAAAGARRVLPGVYHIFIVSQMIENSTPLPEFLTSRPRLPLSAKIKLQDAVLDAVKKMHDAGILHCDLNANNILIRKVKNFFEAFIIDLDKSQIARELPAERRLGNIRRLNRSITKLGLAGKFITRADRMRFLKKFLAGLNKTDYLPAAEKCR